MGEAEQKLRSQLVAREAERRARQDAQAQRAAHDQQLHTSEVSNLVREVLAQLAAGGWPGGELFRAKRRLGWDEKAGWRVAVETNPHYDPDSQAWGMWRQHTYYLLSDGSIVIYDRVTDTPGEVRILHDGFDRLDLKRSSLPTLQALRQGLTQFSSGL